MSSAHDGVTVDRRPGRGGLTGSLGAYIVRDQDDGHHYTRPCGVLQVTDDLETVTGVRQEFTVSLPVRLLHTPPPWEEEPIPFELGSRTTNTATRSTYFAPASARALYGVPGRPCRWHRTVSAEHSGLRLRAMELLRTATARGPDHACSPASDGQYTDAACAASHRASAHGQP